MRIVMLFDKDQEIADRVRAALQPEGFQVLWADSVGEARAILSRRRVDLVIGELPVPPYGYMEDGMDSLSHLGRETIGTPILLLTDWLGLNEARARNRGMAGVIRKSFDDVELVAVVRRQLTPQPLPLVASKTEGIPGEPPVEIVTEDLPIRHEIFVA